MTTANPPAQQTGHEAVAPLLIHVLDVGHGDSIIIEFPGGERFGIIDCNVHPESNKGFNAVAPVDEKEPKALTFFRERKSRGAKVEVEFACLTHPHADHFRGFRVLLEGLERLGVPVKQFWDSGASPKKAQAFLREAAQLAGPANFRDALEITKLYAWVHPIAKARPSFYRTLAGPQDNLFRDFSQDICINAVAPDYTLTGDYANYLGMKPSERAAFARMHPHVRDDNTISSAVLVKYGEFRAVLGGDVTNETWARVVPTPLPGGCQALKLSHHGSVNGNFPSKTSLGKYLGLVTKGSAVISGGYREKLPDDETIKAFRSRKVRVFRTGSIVSEGRFRTVNAQADELTQQQLAASGRTIEAASYHGDITLRCFPGGDHSVAPQFPNPRRPKKPRT